MIKKIGLIFIIIFISLSIDFAIAGSPQFTCGIVDPGGGGAKICNGEYGYWCSLTSPGISSCYVGYAPTTQSTDSADQCTATNRLGQVVYACNSNLCPSFSRNGVTCHIKKTCGVFPACGGTDFTGEWDASETKCVKCNGKFEDKICGDSSAIQLKCDGTCSSGDGQCESACGASAHCDEKSTGVTNYHCHGNERWYCASCVDTFIENCDTTNCGAECDGGTQSQSCGNCGTQTRTCQSDCTWGSWGSCTGEGVCSPGATESCGNCGIRACQSDCTWGSCLSEGVCSPGATQSCIKTCSYKTCSGTSCVSTSVDVSGTQTCQSDCTWVGCVATCPADECLTGADCVSCGDAVCDAGETITNCPQDCCSDDCTSVSDSTCHSECDTYNGCSLSDPGCDGLTKDNRFCTDNCGYLQCCEGSYVDCSQYTCSGGVCTATCDQACGSECDGQEDCPCLSDRCIGDDYYDYPVYGTCDAAFCTCDTGTGSGQPCEPTITYNDPACIGIYHCDSCGDYKFDCQLQLENGGWNQGWAEADDEWYWFNCLTSGATARLWILPTGTIPGVYQLCKSTTGNPGECPQTGDTCVEMTEELTFTETEPLKYWVLAHRKDQTGDAGFEIKLQCDLGGPPPGCLGDLDGDMDVDWFDFGRFANAFGTSTGDPRYNPDADFDNDGVILWFDFGNFSKNYGKTC